MRKKIMMLTRFLEAQEKDYQTALTEIKSGRKRSHWMWYIFPQMRGLGFSETARYYGIENVKEATEYADHPVLGARLVEISKNLLMLDTNNATQIFGSPDDMKLKSCMTLFSSLPNAHPVFQQVLDKFYGGEKDSNTLKLISITS